jgi:ABC-type sulfate/molybdate transport systems ATPase subunit
MALLDIDIALARRSFELVVALALDAETIAVLGPSGAGKTSLLRTVAGLERPQRGRVTLAQEVWLDTAAGVRLAPERRRVGYVPQDYGLFPHLTVAANVRFAARRSRPDLLERVGIAHLADARPPQLSGGERQRVALARALAREPRVLLLDEPFAALDATTRIQVRDELAEELAKLELPTLLVTHAFEDAGALAQRIAVLDNGRLVQLATAAELLRSPASATVAALSGANVLGGIATAAPHGSTVQLDGGGELASDTRAQGAVQIAVHPWELKISDPNSSTLTDRVLSVHPHEGALRVRLSRFVVHTQAGQYTTVAVNVGSNVGLRAAPANVRILDQPDPSADAAAGAGEDLTRQS